LAVDEKNAVIIGIVIDNHCSQATISICDAIVQAGRRSSPTITANYPMMT